MVPGTLVDFVAPLPNVNTSIMVVSGFFIVKVRMLLQDDVCLGINVI
jgi:hypothetical protein